MGFLSGIFKPKGLLGNLKKHMPDDQGNTLHDALVSLESGLNVEAEVVRSHWNRFTSNLSTNCFSAADGQLKIMSRFAVFDYQYSSLFLPDCLRSLYYVGYENLDDIKNFVFKVSEGLEDGWCKQTRESRSVLERISRDDELLIDSFRIMYEEEENDWRAEDDDVDDVPRILL